MKTIVKFLMTGLVIATLLVGGIATAAFAAQPTVTGYSNVQLWVNPEYDEPSLLVMMQGTIAGAAPPATVEFLVPSTAVMYSAGSLDANGKYTGGPPNRVASQIPGWDLISYTITTNTFRVEYYNDIIKGQPDKTIDYQFMTYLPINGMTVAVQQPLKATNFKVEPAGTASSDSQGFNIQTYTYDSIQPADSLNWQISYYKADNVPSITQTPAAGTAGTGGSGGLSTGLVIIIVVIVVVAGIGAVYFMTQRSRPASRADRRRRSGVPRRSAVGSRNAGGGGSRSSGAGPRKSSGGNAGPAVTGGSGGGKFCSNCGAPFEGDAKFCRQCGTPRR